MKCDHCKDTGKVKVRTKGCKPSVEPCAVCRPDAAKAHWVETDDKRKREVKR